MNRIFTGLRSTKQHKQFVDYGDINKRIWWKVFWGVLLIVIILATLHTSYLYSSQKSKISSPIYRLMNNTI